MDFSNLYREQVAAAIFESRKLGFSRPPIISPDTPVADDVLRATSQLISYLSGFFDRVLPIYWGNSCQTLSTNIFAHMNARGIPANIVLGNVMINGTN